MEIRNIASRMGIEPTSVAFRVSVLPLHHLGSLLSRPYPCLPDYEAPGLRGQCRLLQWDYSRPSTELSRRSDSIILIMSTFLSGCYLNGRGQVAASHV